MFGILTGSSVAHFLITSWVITGLNLALFLTSRQFRTVSYVAIISAWMSVVFFIFLLGFCILESRIFAGIEIASYLIFSFWLTRRHLQNLKNYNAQSWFDSYLKSETVTETLPQEVHNNRERVVLFLRPFYLDQLYFEYSRLRTHKGDLERRLSRALPKRKLIGVGETLGHFGIARLKTEDADWKTVVSRLMEEAELVVIWPSVSPGIRWELDLALENYLHKTVFFCCIGLMEAEERITIKRAMEDVEEAERFLYKKGLHFPDMRSEGYFWAYDKGHIKFGRFNEAMQLAKALMMPNKINSRF